MLSHRTAALVSLLGFAVACSSSSSTSSGDGGAGSSSGGDTRTVVSCSDLATQLAPAGGSYVAGSWGDVPAGLQQVPSGGTLCGTIILADGGTVSDQEVVITTSLTGTDLSSFYTPLFTALSCTSTKAVLPGSLAYNCPNDIGNILPSGNEQYILLSYGSL